MRTVKILHKFRATLLLILRTIMSILRAIFNIKPGASNCLFLSAKNCHWNNRGPYF